MKIAAEVWRRHVVTAAEDVYVMAPYKLSFYYYYKCRKGKGKENMQQLTVIDND